METFYGEIDKKFQLIKKIGSGGTSKVYLASMIDKPSLNFAVKIIKSSSTTDLKIFSNEMNVLKQINHPQIVRLIDGGEGVLTKMNGKKSVVQFLVLELVKYGELFDYIFFPGKGFAEEMGRYFFHQLLDGLDACHSAGIVHRDMKTENIMLAEDWKVKIADFGFATKSEGKKGNGILYTALGTASYASPELLQKKSYNGVKSDIFSLGVSLFVLVTGKMPFKHALLDDSYYKEIANENYEKYWSKLAGKVPEVSAEFQDLFTKLIAYKPNSRPSIQDLRDHKWVKAEILSTSEVETELKARTKLILQKKEIERKKQEEEQEKAANGQPNTKFNIYKGEGDKVDLQEQDTNLEFIEIRDYSEEDTINPYTLYLKKENNPAQIFDDLYKKLSQDQNRYSLIKCDKKYKLTINIQSNLTSQLEESLDFRADVVSLQVEVKKTQDDLVLTFTRIEGTKYDFHQAFNEIKLLLES